MHVIDVKVNHVELARLLQHLVYKNQMPGQGVRTIPVEPQRPFDWRTESGRSDRVAAGKQRHFVSLADQFLS
jgi:hypothetical protein